MNKLILILIAISAMFIVPIPSACIVADSPDTPPLIVITLDDGRDTDIDYAYPIASQYDIPLTHYVCPYLVGWSVSYLSWDDIEYLYEQGDDIQCHTYHHWRLPTLTEAEIRWELVATNLAFIEHGLPEPLHMAYPYAAANDFVRNIVSEYRLSGRLGIYGDQVIADADINWCNLKSYPLHGYTLAEIQGMIDDAILNNEVIIFYTHRVYPIQLNGGSTTEHFEDVCQYINSVGIEAVTISECYDRLNVAQTPDDYDTGYTDGYVAGYDHGYNAGCTDGYDLGKDLILTNLSSWLESQS